MSENQSILDWVVSIGGGYVWEAEIFAVTLLDVSLNARSVSRLKGLSGVRQLALNAAGLSFEELKSLVGIEGLESLVLSNSCVSSSQLEELSRSGVEVELLR